MRLSAKEIGNVIVRSPFFHCLQRAAKSLLGVCESLPVSVSLSEPPHSTVADLADVFRQPSHIVSLTLSPLPHESELEREADRRKNDRPASSTAAGRNCCTSHGPTPTASGLYQPPRPSPLSSPQARRRARTPGEDRREMNRLLAGLDEVSQTLERTQSRCDDIARRCESGGQARSAGEEETDWASDDQRVERLLRVAESLTAQIMVQQRRSPTPSATTSSEFSGVCVCIATWLLCSNSPPPTSCFLPPPPPSHSIIHHPSHLMMNSRPFVAYSLESQFVYA